MVPQHLERDTPTRSQRTACLIHRLENTVRAVFLVYDNMYRLRNPRAAAFLVALSQLASGWCVLVVGGTMVAVVVVVGVEVVVVIACG